MDGPCELHSTEASASPAWSRTIQATVSISFAEGWLEMPGMRRKGEP
jgi:hypothetical protein